MLMYTYFKSALTKSSQTRVDEHVYLTDKTPRFLININMNNYKFCEFCQAKKFHTASHCKYCEYCVLRRDHHCVWIANCVGIRNNQYFVNFCVWVIVNSLINNEFIDWYDNLFSWTYFIFTHL